MKNDTIESIVYIMEYKSIELLENNGCVITHIAGVNVNINTMKVYGTAVCINDYGSTYRVAKVEILANIEEKLSLYRDACKSKYNCVTLKVIDNRIIA